MENNKTQKKDNISTAVSRVVYKQLQQLKLDYDFRTINNVVEMLLEERKKNIRSEDG